ncbi:MAG TPA: hypothetical protein VIU46_11710 [Gallionellaceae bacterium]
MANPAYSHNLHQASSSAEVPRARTDAPAPAFRKAGLLDLPFIFNQIVEGCVEGVYSDLFLTGGGNVHLMRLLFLNLLPFGKLLGKRKLYDFLIFRKGQEEIGFVGMYAARDAVSGDAAKHQATLTIGFFGVAQAFRGKHKGIMMMRMLLEHLPADATIDAYTTKYAVGMQRLLTRSGFRQTGDQPTSKQKKYFLDKREGKWAGRHHPRAMA